MNNLLCKIFIKNHTNTEEPSVRESYGKFASILGVITNIILCTGKIAAGIISGSVSIVADGINNLTDATSSIVTFIGFRISAIPGDKRHPYGHARFEYISGIIVAMLVLVAGIELLESAVKKIFYPAEIRTDNLIILILIISIIIKIWQASFYFFVSRKIDSITLRATGTDSRNDVISTTAVLSGLLITRFTSFNVDGFIGTLVALFIIYSGIELIKETISPLLGEAPTEEIVEEITRISMSDPKVLGIHDLVIHNYGPGKTFATIHIEVNENEALLNTHDIADKIEYEILDKLNIEMTVHIDPVKSDDAFVNSIFLLLTKIAEGFKGLSHIHDLRIIPEKDKTKIMFDVILSENSKENEDELVNHFNDELKKIDQKYYVVINFDKKY